MRSAEWQRTVRRVNQLRHVRLAKASNRVSARYLLWRKSVLRSVWQYVAQLSQRPRRTVDQYCSPGCKLARTTSA